MTSCLCQKTDDELSQKEHLGQENEWVLNMCLKHLLKKVDFLEVHKNSVNLYIL